MSSKQDSGMAVASVLVAVLGCYFGQLPPREGYGEDGGEGFDEEEFEREEGDFEEEEEELGGELDEP